MTAKKAPHQKGKLRIGDNWNAITIIALSQSNPLKAIAEFVENSIDAKAQNITIVRGQERGDHYLKITDDGEGIHRTEAGLPDFAYVATHICDSIKREIKSKGAEGIQGEFGIGLLSFWTVGEELTMASSGNDGRGYQMRMSKGDPGYTIHERRSLLPLTGVELVIRQLLPGVRQLSGEKIQWYLASELRDRIRASGVTIKVIDRRARKEFIVEPREFAGRLLHHLGPLPSPLGDVYTELYLGEPDSQTHISLYRAGTRILEDMRDIDIFNHEPWLSPYLQGIIDAPFLNLTPGTRSGVIQDEALQTLESALVPLEQQLIEIIDGQRRAEEERASVKILRSVQNALREAVLSLPAEQYDWFDIHAQTLRKTGKLHTSSPDLFEQDAQSPDAALSRTPVQKQFFEFAGPLFSVKIVPQSCVLPVGETKTLHAVARDKSKKHIDDTVSFFWEVAEGDGRIASSGSELAVYTAAQNPGLVKIRVSATQGDITCPAEAMITVTESLLPEISRTPAVTQGLPGYTFKKASGELWRSQYHEEQNVIVINNGHRDFVFASKNKTLKIRYIARLFAKELVCKNFKGTPADELLERMIELTLYMEENL